MLKMIMTNVVLVMTYISTAVVTSQVCLVLISDVFRNVAYSCVLVMMLSFNFAEHIIVNIDVIGSAEEAPYFEEKSYEAPLDEALPFNRTVITVTAINPAPGESLFEFNLPCACT